MDYAKTLNLPQTKFSMRANLTSLEPKIQEKWKKMDIYKKVLKKRENCPKWVLHDGPPYADGDVHFGTALNKILKDAFVKFKTMRGFYSPYVPGWDCHGLPIELKVLKEHGNLPTHEIRSHCSEFARKYVTIQRKQFIALGVLGDWDNPYLTLNPEYEAAIIEVFEKLFEKGHIYRQNRPIHWCINCTTALAYAELEYKEKESPSIYVRFPTDRDFDLVVWTTTPWTLPANLATVAHPHYDYVLFEYGRGKGVICEALVEKLTPVLGIKKIIKKFRGKELEGIKYNHPLFDQTCPVLMANYVSLTDGTGLVHTAPGHGLEDYRTGLDQGLKIFSPVDRNGRFTKEAGEFEGDQVFKANDRIIDKLKKKEILLDAGKVTHSYPHCWRCHDPVIFRATEQWFISVDHNEGRSKALAEISRTKWFPQWGESRITSMLEERPDWCISRQRTWGVPIPAFYCTNCNEVLLTLETIRAVKEFILANGGCDSWFESDPRQILPSGTKCSKCKGESFRKEMDIFDVWFESAASHRAVCMKHHELSFPSDLYLEATDQHRGWFQVSLLASVLTVDASPFKSVLTHGWVKDATTGVKFSKSGFMVRADEVVKKLGTDILRLWVSGVNYTDDMFVTWETFEGYSEQYKKIRNTFRFMLANTADLDLSKHAQTELCRLDSWALLELNKLVKKVTGDFDNFEVYKAYHRLYDFCVVTLSSNYFYMIKDRLYTLPGNSRSRRSAQTALYKILVTMTKLFAPILVHTTEEIWEHITGPKEDSVHLSDWPEAQEINEVLYKKWEQLFAIRGEVNKKIEELRAQKVVGSSLESEIELGFEDNTLLNDFKDELKEFFVVSKVTIGKEQPSKGLYIKVEKSKFPKCERCWMYSDSVATSMDHPTLCNRCIEAIKQAA